MESDVVRELYWKMWKEEDTKSVPTEGEVTYDSVCFRICWWPQDPSTARADFIGMLARLLFMDSSLPFFVLTFKSTISPE